MASLPGYDAWKTANPYDDEHHEECSFGCGEPEPDCICAELEAEDHAIAAELEREALEWDEVA